MKRAKNYLVVVLGMSLLGVGLLVNGSNLAAPATGTWVPAGTMAAARSGAATALLTDGRVLVTGGSDAAGATLSAAEFFNSDGSFTAAPPMNFARSGHTATLLQDGRVLVAGGTDATGNAAQTAELFDPSSNSWTAAGPLMAARSGQTATLLQNGQLLLAGGAANGAALASLELFDPMSNAFSLAPATLSTARQSHAAALLSDGRVLVMGGWDGTMNSPPSPQSPAPSPLSSSDIYDPAAGTVTTGPAMNSARMNFTATVQLDGKVAVIGGSNGQADLASIEVFDPAAGSFVLGGSLTTARSGHLAFLLPHNANILVVGGSSAGVALSSVELYTPWTAATSVTGSMASARASAAGSPLSGTVAATSMSPSTGYGLDGMLMVAGGLDTNHSPLATSEVYGFATVKTDAADYPPGTTVNITGSGWQPNETVQLSLVEVPDVDADSPIPLSATADANGNISNSSFTTDWNDAGIKLALTAVGSASQAQMKFTDNPAPTVSCNPNPDALNTQTTCYADIGGNTTGDTMNWSKSGSGTFTATSCSVTATGGSVGGQGCHVGFTPSATGSQNITATDPQQSTSGFTSLSAY